MISTATHMLLYFKYFCLDFLQENKQWDCFRKTGECFCRERKNRGRWKRSVPVIRKGIICELSQSPNGS